MHAVMMAKPLSFMRVKTGMKEVKTIADIWAVMELDEILPHSRIVYVDDFSNAGGKTRVWVLKNYFFLIG